MLTQHLHYSFLVHFCTFTTVILYTTILVMCISKHSTHSGERCCDVWFFETFILKIFWFANVFPIKKFTFFKSALAFLLYFCLFSFSFCCFQPLAATVVASLPITCFFYNVPCEVFMNVLSTVFCFWGFPDSWSHWI